MAILGVLEKRAAIVTCKPSANDDGTIGALPDPAAHVASGRRGSTVKARRCDVRKLVVRRPAMTTSWNADAARAQYAIAHWGENYFDVDDAGRLIVRPRGAGTRALALEEIVDAAHAKGSRLPLLVRFADILRDRLARLQGAFAQAMRDWDYTGGYSAIYP